MRVRLLAATFVAANAVLAFVPATPAQQVSGGPDRDRKASTLFISNESSETLAAVFLSYSPASWRDNYDRMLTALDGSNYTRLGNGWWATIDSVGALEIGGTTIEAGSYYLGLAVGKEGAFSLLFFDSRQAMKARLLPGTTALYTGEAKAETKAPLTFAKDSLKESVVKLEIEITAEKADPATGKFSIRWGRHELSAPVKFHLAGATEAAGARK